MSDPGASPVRGQSVRLEGKPIGRVQAGFIAGEDFIFQDKTGLMAVDFRSMLGLLGNLFAGWRRVPKHFDQPGEVTGWFKRGMGGYLVQRELKTAAGTLRARPLFWQILLSIIVIIGNFVLAAGDDVKRLGRLTQSYQLVEGAVAKVGEGAGRLYLNFADDWRSDFTISIERKDVSAFTAAGIDLKGLAGKRLRVRGWVEWRNGPMIAATHPEQLELLAAVATSRETNPDSRPQGAPGL